MQYFSLFLTLTDYYILITKYFVPCALCMYGIVWQFLRILFLFSPSSTLPYCACTYRTQKQDIFDGEEDEEEDDVDDIFLVVQVSFSSSSLAVEEAKLAGAFLFSFSTRFGS